MRAVAAASLTVLLLALACVAGATTEAPTEAPACCPCPCDPCGCGPGCDCPPVRAEGLRPWFPGKVLWRTVSFPFRKHAPKRPVAPRLWPRCYEVTTGLE